MKYVVLELEGKEYIFLFPNCQNLTHEFVAETLEHTRVGSRDHWSRDFRYSELVSAGFVDGNLNCHGYSETLKMGSRNEIDTELLKGEF